MRTATVVSAAALLFAISPIASASDVLALCPREEHLANWGRLPVGFEYAGAEVELSTSGDLPAGLDAYKVIAIAVSATEYGDEKARLFDWVRGGGRLVFFFLNSDWVPDGFLPGSLALADADPEGVFFPESGAPLAEGLSGKAFAGNAGDAAASFGPPWTVLAWSGRGDGRAASVLHMPLGQGGILVAQLHLGASRNADLALPLARNIVRWAGMEARQEYEAAEDPYVRAADWAAMSTPPWLPFDWGEGVQTYGLMEAYAHTGEKRYLEAVRDWADHHIGRGLTPILEGSGTLRDYCGHWGPGAPVLLLYEETGEPKYLQAGETICDFIRSEAARTDEGALGHYADNYQIWVDTLFMACPTLTLYAAHSGSEWAMQDAVKQLELAVEHVQDEGTGLFYHMWDSETGQHSPEFWGRGNGWVIMSFVDTLEALPQEHPSREALAASYRRQVRGLLAHQADSGLWRTVVTRPDSYEETSATAMIAYGLAKGLELGLIDGGCAPAIRKAWKALKEQVDERGAVMGVSAGTGPTNFEGYQGRPTGEFPWGTGAFLMAGSQIRGMGLAE